MHTLPRPWHKRIQQWSNTGMLNLWGGGGSVAACSPLGCYVRPPGVSAWKPLWLFISDVFCYWHCWHHSILPNVWSSHQAHTTNSSEHQESSLIARNYETSKSEIYTRWLVIVTKHASMSLKCSRFYLLRCSSRFSLALGFSPQLLGKFYTDLYPRWQLLRLNKQSCNTATQS